MRDIGETVSHIPDEMIDMYNNPHLLRELKKAHINGTLFPDTNPPIAAYIFTDPETTGAADTPVSHIPDIESSV